LSHTTIETIHKWNGYFLWVIAMVLVYEKFFVINAPLGREHEKSNRD
jgi:hypothetical protein